MEIAGLRYRCVVTGNFKGVVTGFVYPDTQMSASNNESSATAFAQLSEYNVRSPCTEIYHPDVFPVRVALQ